MTKKRLAVIGKDVSKSVSPQIHTFIASRLDFAVEYDKISIPEKDFEYRIDALLRTFDGLNVTIPYKLPIIPHLKTVDGDAKVFGAVNTVNCKTLTGYNTDGLGFILMLNSTGIDACGKEVLLLGAGGAGRSVAKMLADAGACVYVYDANITNALAIEREFKGVHALGDIADKPYYLIVNATGVGMHKTEGVSPVSESLLSLCEAAVDLIYVPERSEFLRRAEKYGKKTINGKAMLFYQAYYADCIFFGLTPDEVQAEKLFTEFCEVGK